MTDIFIDEIFSLVEQGEAFSLPASWTQGRTLYGGLTAAMLLKALEVKVDPAKSLRALNIAFSGPTFPEQDFSIQTELLREGKSIAQWQARLIQNDVVCVQVQAVFGLPVKSELEINSFCAPDIGGLDKARFYPSENAPGFIHYFEMGQSQGEPPLAGGNSLKLGGYMKFREKPESMGICHLVAAIDVWPPATMMQMKTLKAGSTVNWTMQFPQPLPVMDASVFLEYQASIEFSRDGFGITHAKVWNSHGELLALSQQTLIVYG